VRTPAPNKKLILYPPGFPARPYASYHDEIVRWYDYWLKGIDTGIMDEPPIKLFVMGINKWKFENEWPLVRTNWTKYYLHPAGGLSAERVKDTGKTDTFTQPAPYLDPTVYCLKYSTGPLAVDTEVTGPIALYLEATIDIDDTNWMADLVDVDPEGNRQWVSVGYLKAKFRALDESESKPYLPIHPRQDPVPVTPGKKTEYAISMMSTSVIFQKGHSMELIIRNQDDVLSRLGTWGTYMLPFMQTVTHNIHFGNSYLLLPVIPAGLPR
jgi:predicted acyl esterase